MKPVYLSYYKRSAFSRANSRKPEVDSFAAQRADVLLAHLIDHCLDDNGLNSDSVDDLSIGCALGVKEQWSFGGRYPLLLSQLGDQCASRSIDQQCGSGIAALRASALNIASGAADLAIAGGYEHMTRIPMGPSLFQEGTLTVPQLSAAIQNSKAYDMTHALNMGLTAENLAAFAGISREQMDHFAVRSHERAAQAQAANYLAGEIIALPAMENSEATVHLDSCIRAGTTAEALSELKTVFKEDGVISAGNSSPLTTGAALGLLASESAVQQHNLTPMARIVACVDRGVRPEMMGQSVVPAVQRLLQQTGFSASDIDFWEINEAFSVVPLYAIQSLGIDAERVNVHGGALALGHPLGATGIRLVGTLARTLHQQQGRYGIAAACIGGGQGIAMLIERV
jgi:acetyl-CoA C-acetyltransferase